MRRNRLFKGMVTGGLAMAVAVAAGCGERTEYDTAPVADPATAPAPTYETAPGAPMPGDTLYGDPAAPGTVDQPGTVDPAGTTGEPGTVDTGTGM